MSRDIFNPMRLLFSLLMLLMIKYFIILYIKKLHKNIRKDQRPSLV